MKDALDNYPYGSSDVAQKIGISLRQLYHWIKLFRVIEPKRVQCGTRQFRRYTVADVRILLQMKNLIDQGFTVRAAAQSVKRDPTQ